MTHMKEYFVVKFIAYVSDRCNSKAFVCTATIEVLTTKFLFSFNGVKNKFLTCSNILP